MTKKAYTNDRNVKTLLAAVCFSSVDGYQVQANMFKVTMPIPKCVEGTPLSLSPITVAQTAIDGGPTPLPNTVCEKFFADTGANQHLHPNGRSAISFSRVSIDISTAATGNSMR